MHMFEVIMRLLLAAGMALAGWFTVAPPAQNATPVETTAPVAATAARAIRVFFIEGISKVDE